MTCWWNWIEGGGNVRIQAVVETAIYVDDLQATETFYGTVLGLRVMGKEPGRHVFFQAGEASVLLAFLAEATLKGDQFPGRVRHSGEGVTNRTAHSAPSKITVPFGSRI